MRQFACIIVGDELLSGRRQDKHLHWLATTLSQRGCQLVSARYIGDQLAAQAELYRQSMASDAIVFSFGGIGATPDDHSRQAAATAAGVELIQHPEATALIEARFGEAARPNRIKMAQLPAGCRLIPNPVNQVAGFSIADHHFLPGFPEMAWPMAEWVLEHYYPHLQQSISRHSLIALDAKEGDLIPLMEHLVQQWPQLSFSCLPSYGNARCPQPHIEFSVAGDALAAQQAFDWLQAQLQQRGYALQQSAQAA